MKRDLIAANPVLSPYVLTTARQLSMPNPLDGPSVRFFAYGRAALLKGLEILGIQPGENVLIPSLVCRVVLAPFHVLGIEYRFYPVSDCLQPDFEKATALVDGRTRAFLGIHYFGFPQDVEAAAKFCAERHLSYIEDNAHGFLSARDNQPLGTSGDISIFSFRKTIPVPNGAALVVNNPAVCGPGEADFSSLSSSRLGPHAAFLLRNMLRNGERWLGIPVTHRVKEMHDRLSSRRRAANNGNKQENEVSGYLSGLSPISDALIRHFDWARIRQARISAFHAWRGYFERERNDATPIFTDLPEGVVPYAFPVLVQHREKWLEVMARHGIECFPWPDLPADSPEETFRCNLAAVPLHVVPRFA